MYKQCYFTYEPDLTYAEKESKVLKDDFCKLKYGVSLILDSDNRVTIVNIHKGFLTSGFTMPKFLKNRIKSSLKNPCKIILLHDYLFEHMIVEEGMSPKSITRTGALRIFLSLLSRQEISKDDYNFIAFFATINSFLHFNKHKFYTYKRAIEETVLV